MALADPRDSHPLEYPLEEPSWMPAFREGVIDPILPDENNGRLQPFTRPGLGFKSTRNCLKNTASDFQTHGNSA
ncbi:MAG: hypothetical protein R2860_03330 [Desulfobacterales bacterium]